MAKAKMNVDDILRHIGEFGPYQKIIYIIINLIGITHGFRLLLAVFMLYTPKHRCAIPNYRNDTYKIQSPEHADLVTQFIPNNTKDAEFGPYDLCHVFRSDGARNGSSGAARSVAGCDKWVYDKSMFTNTAVMEFHAVCDDSMLGPHSQMSQMGGFLFGVLFFGAIGDKFGRKKAMYIAILIYVAGGFGLSWAPLIGYPFFVFLRFINGATSAGAYTAVCVLSVEMVGPNKRLWVGVLIHLSFGLGGLLLDLIGYLQRDWFLINILGTAPAILALSFWWIVPESPRWLARKDRLKEAEVILRKIAKFNGKTFPEFALVDAHSDDKEGIIPANQPDIMKAANEKGLGHVASDKKLCKPANEDLVKTANEMDLVRSTNENHNGKHSVETVSGALNSNRSREVVAADSLKNGKESRTDHHTGKTKGTFRELLRMFTYRVLLIRILVQFLNWFAVSMAYYGLSLTANELKAGGLYVNFLLSMCMDILANILVLVLLDRWGRRPLHTFNMVTGGLACLLGALTTMVAPSGLQWMTVVVAMVGKLGSSAGFTLIYIYSTELCPTTVRSAGMGAASAFARLGSILASYVQQWSVDMGGDLGHALPLLVFGAFSLVAGVMTLLLPETLHKDLPDTVEDALVFGRDPKKDEHTDPKKVTEVFTVDKVQIEMESLKFPPTHGIDITSMNPKPGPQPSTLQETSGEFAPLTSGNRKEENVVGNGQQMSSHKLPQTSDPEAFSYVNPALEVETTTVRL